MESGGEEGREKKEKKETEAACFHFSWEARVGLPQACIRPVKRLGLVSHYCQS